MRNFLIFFYNIKILKRIIPSLLKIYINIFNKSNIIIDQNNKKYNLNLKNSIDRELFFKKEYEKENLDYLINVIKNEEINFFLDIGAHMGYYTVEIADYFKNIKIYSFEPIDKNYNQLKTNITINNINDRVKSFHIALSDQKKEAVMWVPDKNKTGGFSIFDKNDLELKKYNSGNIYKENTFCDKIDNLVAIQNQKIAIKIDVERHEKFVLLGGEKLIKNNKILLQVEIFEQEKSKMNDFLKKNKFYFLANRGKDYFYKNY